METLILYLVKMNVVFTILFAAYLLLFKNEKAFNVNRCFLLSALVLSVVLPLVPSLNFMSDSKFPDYVTGVNPLRVVFAQAPGAAQPMVASAFNTGSWAGRLFTGANIIWLAVAVYLLVVFVLLNRFIYQLLNLYFLCKTGKRYKAGGVIYCEHDKSLSPFSFFNILFINPSGDYGDLEQVIEHEKIHIDQWHSADVLFTELIGILLWINPLTIFLKRYTKLNLEYIADEGVLRTGVDKRQYQLSILHNSTGYKAYPLTNLFSSSKLKLRIKMINQNKKPGLYKYLIVLPLVLVGYLLINPSAANSARTYISNSKDTPITAFEGIYQNQDAPTAYFELKAVNNTLVANRLDFKKQFTLNRTGELTFENKNGEGGQTMQIVFTKNDAGRITEGRVNGHTPWVKVKEYKPVVTVTLTAEQLKAFEGKYQFESNKNAFLTITAGANSLTMNTLWDGKKKENLVPLSDHEFLNIAEAFDLKFIKDDKGNVIKMVAYTKDMWDKVSQ